MKIVVTGSLGHISKPLTQTLLANGHQVTVISSSPTRQAEIEALGATAAIGKMQDAGFLTKTFTGADVVYAMEALAFESYFDHSLNLMAAIREIVEAYKQAIEQSGVKKVIHLSSIGAHMPSGNGLLEFHYHAEQILQQLPPSIAIKFMRPVGFYYNMFAFIKPIKTQGAIYGNYSGDEKEPWVSPLDIAATIAQEIDLPFDGRTIHYIASDEVTPDQIANILGKAIGRPDIYWQQIRDEEALNGLLQAGMNPEIANLYVQMNAARRNGVLYQDYFNNPPALGSIKVTDFAQDFATAYNQQ